MRAHFAIVVTIWQLQLPVLFVPILHNAQHATKLQTPAYHAIWGTIYNHRQTVPPAAPP